MPDPEGIAKALRAPLLKVFPPALLGRLIVIPYYPLSDEMIARHHPPATRPHRRRASPNITSVPFTYDDDVVELIASRCTELESGGRMIDAILTNTMLPAISAAFLQRVLEGEKIARVHVTVENGEFGYSFD